MDLANFVIEAKFLQYKLVKFLQMEKAWVPSETRCLVQYNFTDSFMVGRPTYMLPQILNIPMMSPTASVTCRRGLWMQIDTWPWSHTYWGRMVLTGPQVCKWVKSYIFRLSYKLTSHDLWPSSVTFDLMNMWRFLHYINKPSLVPIGLQLFNWGHFYIFSLSYNLTSDDLWHWYVNFDLINKWGFPCCIYDPTLVEIHQSM